MSFYQLRTSIIPILLLSTAACIVAWQIRSGVDCGRATRMADLIDAYSAGRITEQTARARLADSCTEQDLWRCLTNNNNASRSSVGVRRARRRHCDGRHSQLSGSHLAYFEFF